MTKRMIMLVSAVVLIALVAVGGTLAYMTASPLSAANVVEIGNVNIDVVNSQASVTETVVPGVPAKDRDIKVRNRGNNDAYIRIKITPAANMNTSLVKFSLTARGGNVMKQDTDGYFYLKSALKVGATLDLEGQFELDKSVTGPADVGSKDGRFDYNIKVEAIQTDHIDGKRSIGGTAGFPAWPNAEIQEYNK